MSETTRRHSRSEQRRREILDAALACFTELGFSATTMADIRQRSGASTGSIYHHFKNKEQLAGALYLEGLKRYQQGLISELKRHRQAECGIRGVVAFHLRWVEQHPPWAKYLQDMRRTESVVALDDDIAALNRGFVVQAQQWLSPFIERGQLKSLALDLYLAVLFGPCNEYGRYWLARRTQTDMKGARRQLADAAWAAVRADTDHASSGG